MMTVHKLTTGDGYTYLTRQVASADEQRSAGQSLADYYTTRGNPPGAWIGGGARALDLDGTPVSESQMKALFGEGRHPDREAMLAAGADDKATRLGAPYPRTTITKDGRVRRPVAGYDLVFTPVKSVSVLWALGGPETRQAVEDAHHAAVASTLQWIEQHAAFTRTGHAGIAQIDTTGLVAAAFDHRDSRTGDPDLHTHVAVANKVQGIDGKWRSLDARVLHSVGVAASERYNTRIEDELHRRLGVEFAERAGTDAGKRPIREIVGVPRALLTHFSKRRVAIEDRYSELLRDYRAEHGKEPGRATQLQLAQQATLETREGKAPGRTMAEQVADWTDQAVGIVGGSGIARMLTEAIGRDRKAPGLGQDEVDAIARQVVLTVSQERSTWTRWNAYAEAERALRSHRFPTSRARQEATDAVVRVATSEKLSIRIEEPELVVEPTALRRETDGQSVYRVHGGERYTTSAIITAEESLVTAATTPADAVDPLVAEAALAVHESEDHVTLDPGQRHLVDYFATYPGRLAVGIGPAGAGKTTAMRAFAAVLAADGRRLIPLATSAKSAQILGHELGLRAENLHKFLHEQEREVAEERFLLGPRDVVLVDEAGMAGTLQLARLVDLAGLAGAVVRLVGDPAQLSAVEAGGALRLLDAEVGAVRLDHLHRFEDPDEALATTQLREGDPAALTFYLQHDRVKDGSREAMLNEAYDAWAADMRAGLTSLLIASTSSDVRAFNTRARAERIALGQVEEDGVLLRDDTRAGCGDWIVTRTNLRGATCHHGSDWVKNGDTWEVLGRRQDGSLSVRHLAHGGRVRLSADYVRESVELAYATTTHRSQGATVDTAHALITGETTRESLYVSSTRGRLRNSWYAATEELLDAATDHAPEPPAPLEDLLARVLARAGGEQAAITTIRETQREATSLPVLVARYRDARDHAALAMLRTVAPVALPHDLSARVLADHAAKRLAAALAAAAGQAADPSEVLAAAAAYDDLDGARSPALVLASRINDLPHTLGITGAPAPGPLPWLPAPVVGHPEWDGYLAARAALIANRAAQLGSLRAAYREQYRLTHLPSGDLGAPPPEGTVQRDAFSQAQREQSADAPRPRPWPATPVPPSVRTRGPRLTR